MKMKLMAAAVAALMAGGAQAAVVTFTTSINVPNNINGVYINLLTGATGTTSTATPGYDFNPYTGATNIQFFWGAGAGGVAGTTTGPYLSLLPGATVSAASTFATTTSALQTTAFQTTGTHILGFRFTNESTSAVNYGYLTMTNTAPSGFPATITGWSFENSGGAITVAGAVPEPATWAMMIGGFGLAGGVMRRRAGKVSYAAA